MVLERSTSRSVPAGPQGSPGGARAGRWGLTARPRLLQNGPLVTDGDRLLPLYEE